MLNNLHPRMGAGSPKNIEMGRKVSMSMSRRDAWPDTVMPDISASLASERSSKTGRHAIPASRETRQNDTKGLVAH